ncbi:hypothetical protein [Formosa sp. PL04]|uniref:hypothetical protein n=1 Tax=Formosa sp. PL04 TaxID=3081755 RepID=UPI002982A4F6|nr:hypothetical protein [Formosa sp. PL04]MDW5290688.1 hypothetical protein [Formosa sp. PL04]
MPNLKTILQEISDITYTIETDYPELYKYLDEQPITIPAFEHPNMNKKLMKEYLKELKELLESYVVTHQKEK